MEKDKLEKEIFKILEKEFDFLDKKKLMTIHDKIIRAINPRSKNIKKYDSLQETASIQI